MDLSTEDPCSFSRSFSTKDVHIIASESMTNTKVAFLSGNSSLLQVQCFPLIVSTSAVVCGSGRIGVNQDHDEDASTMAQGTHLHLGIVE